MDKKKEKGTKRIEERTRGMSPNAGFVSDWIFRTNQNALYIANAKKNLFSAGELVFLFKRR
jgi:hypothetical protein